MSYFATDHAVVLSGRETIYRGGKRVGWLSSRGVGYTVNKSIGCVRSGAAFVLSVSYSLEVATTRVLCEDQLTPLYEPKMERVKY